MARPATTVRGVEDSARQASPVVDGWHVGEDSARYPGRRRHGRADQLEHGERGLHLLPGPSARCRRPLPRTAPPRPKKSQPLQHHPDEALGRSRGGLTCKIHLAGEGGRRPLAFIITPGQWSDSPQLIPVLKRIRVPRPGGGHPRTRPDHLSGDKAYNSRQNRSYLWCRQVKHTIPERKDQRANRQRSGSAGGRPAGFDRAIYKRRNEVERTIGLGRDDPCFRCVLLRGGGRSGGFSDELLDYGDVDGGEMDPDRTPKSRTSRCIRVRQLADGPLCKIKP